jgi:hypothetical protein
MSIKSKRLMITFSENDPIWDILDKISKANHNLFSTAELIKQLAKNEYDKLFAKKDLTLEDIERIGWANISTQELIDRYPPYRKQFNEAVNDTDFLGVEESQKFLNELRASVKNDYVQDKLPKKSTKATKITG